VSQSQPESYGDEKKNHLSLPGIVTPDLPVRGTVTTPTVLLLLPKEIKYKKIQNNVTEVVK